MVELLEMKVTEERAEEFQDFPAPETIIHNRQDEEPNESWSLTRLAEYADSRARKWAKDKWLVGRALKIAKKKCGKADTWRAWLEREVPHIDYQDARRCVRLAEECDNPDALEGLSIRKAYLKYGILTEQKPREKRTPRAKDTPTVPPLVPVVKNPAAEQARRSEPSTLDISHLATIAKKAEMEDKPSVTVTPPLPQGVTLATAPPPSEEVIQDEGAEDEPFYEHGLTLKALEIAREIDSMFKTDTDAKRKLQELLSVLEELNRACEASYTE